MPGRVSSGCTTSAPHPATYTVTLRNTATGPTEAAQGLSLLARDIGKRAPGEDMNVSTLQLLYDAGAVADASLAGEPVGCPIAQRTLALASGCPPGRAVSFDIAASRFITRNSEELLVDHGCSNEENEHEREAAHALHSGQEDVIPCVWARHDFYPVFRLHDNLTGHSGTYNGSFRAQHLLLFIACCHNFRHHCRRWRRPYHRRRWAVAGRDCGVHGARTAGVFHVAGFTGRRTYKPRLRIS